MKGELKAWVESVRPAAAGGEWTPIERGGSDRHFWRGRGAASGLVAVHYGMERAENVTYAAAAEFLATRGVNVPRCLAHDGVLRFLLLEDAGEEDLWTHRCESWTHRRELYMRALEQGAKLHAIDPADASGLLQPPFDESLYRWEQEYFREHFLGTVFPAEVAPVLEAQAAGLAALPRVLLHRDFQSQNIMVRDGAVSLIDFQGLRAGLAGYDVASLVYDPYVPMTPDERDELAAAYPGMAGRAGGDAWDAELRACARQRLMQALGAYGFLGRVKGKTAFLGHIPVAAARLAELCEAGEAWRPLAAMVRETAEAFSP